MATKIRHVCDRCGSEKDRICNDYQIQVGEKITLGVLVQENDGVTDVHLCQYCIVDAIKGALDDRPRESRHGY